MTSRTLVLVATAGAFALASCSADDDRTPTSSSSPSVEVSDSGPGTRTPDPGTEDAAPPSKERRPLLDFFDSVYGPASTDAEIDALDQKSEAFIATCMADSGFTYVPIDRSAQQRLTVTPSSTGAALDEKSAATEGYGLGSMLQEPTQAPSESPSADEDTEDPNAEYVDSLSDAGKKAYEEALSGRSSAQLADTPTDTPWEQSGCMGAAWHEFYDHTEINAVFDAHEPLMTAWGELSVWSHPDVVALDPAWSDCMAAAGFTFARHEDASASVQKAYEGLLQEASDTGAVPSPSETARLRELEITTAVADARCQSTVQWDETYEQAQFELEEQFLVDHKAELEAFRADYEATQH